MEIKILQVFYDRNGLPYKDKERTVHYPITSGTFLGASNTTQIRFYYDQLDELNESTFVAVSKLPNGKIGSEILESSFDEELNENYVTLSLSQFYTQYKGDVYISLQGFQGGVRVEQDENGIYSIIGTPTIQATGSIKLSVAYAPTFIGSGETENITLQRVLAELSTKLGIRQETLYVEELPTVGNPNVWYVIKNDPNDTTKANIYIWNATTQTYVWVGDNTLNLGNYYTQEEGEQFESGINNRVTSVENELSSVASGSPKGVYATLSDLETAYPTGTDGIYVVSANGHWYYWNGTAWTDGGVYLSTANAVPETRTIAGVELDHDITREELQKAIDIPAILAVTGKEIQPFTKGYYLTIPSTGTLNPSSITGSSNMEYLITDVSGQNVVFIKCDCTGTGLMTYAFTDASYNILETGIVSTWYNETIKVPSGAKYLAINSLKGLGCCVLGGNIPYEINTQAMSPFVEPNEKYLGIEKIIIKKDDEYVGYYTQYIWHNANGFDLYMVIVGKKVDNSYEPIAYLTRTTAPASVPPIEIFTTPVCQVYINWSKMASTVEVSGYREIKSNCIVDEYNPYTFNRPFALYLDNKFDPIINVEVEDLGYAKYLIEYFWHNENGYETFIRLSGEDENGTITPIYDFARTTQPSNRPTIETFYNQFASITINWSLALASISASGKNYLKQNCVKSRSSNAQMSGYAIKDFMPESEIIVDCNGNGDFTTIGAAYTSIFDSSPTKQKNIVVLPGTYNENNLIPPKWTHTFAAVPGTVIVTSESFSGTNPVFDQVNPSKLSNLKIISHTGYCIHVDNVGENGLTVVNTNLYCKKATTGAIIGGGFKRTGLLYEWHNCTFENGYVAYHTQPQDALNTIVKYINCKLVNAYYYLSPIGGIGNCQVEFIGNHFDGTNKDVILLVNGIQRTSESNGYKFYANPMEIKIGGYGNKNLLFDFTNYLGKGLCVETASNNQNISSISGTAVAALFGNITYKSGFSRQKGKAFGDLMVDDIQINNTDIVQMWKRLGDCSVTNKTLSITVNGTTETYTFDQDYTSSKPSESTLLAAVNSALTIAKLVSYNTYIDQNLTVEDIQNVVVTSANGILKGEWITYDGSIASASSSPYDVYGVALEDGASGDTIKVWVGKKYYIQTANGEYGIVSSGNLDTSASTKIGYVKNNILTRYDY